MNRRTKFLLALACVAALCACTIPQEAAVPTPTGGPAPGQSQVQAPTLIPDAPPPETEDGHVHRPADRDTTLEHEPGGYCGNTMTTVTRVDGGSVLWEKSFWGDDSVQLTDFLRWLDCSGPVCKCLPEYQVDTEFGSDYGVSLTGGYVRHGDGQAQLTQEQLEQLQELLRSIESQT